MPTKSLFLIFLITNTFLLGDFAKIELHTEAVVLMNAKTGKILFERNADQRMNPASITKIATALYTLNTASHHLDDMITTDHDSVAWASVDEKKRSKYTLPPHWLEPGYSTIGLKRGETMSLNDLLYGMMLASGDDASNVIAKYVGGTVPQFMELVNQYLASLGCHNTHFSNPHGLYHPNHYTTPYDMAVMTKAALENPQFRTIVKTVRYPRPRTNMQEPNTWVQGNKLLRSGPHYYAPAIGVKTGYIQVAQNTLVAAAEKDGRTLIAVLMKCKDRSDIFADAKKLFQTAFNEKLEEKKLIVQGPQKFSMQHAAISKPINTYADEEVAINFYPSEEPKLKCNLVWHEVKLPIKAGDTIGELLIASDDGQIDRKIALKSQEDVNKSFLGRFIAIFSGWSSSQIMAGIMLVLVIAFGLALRRK